MAGWMKELPIYLLNPSAHVSFHISIIPPTGEDFSCF